MKSNRHGLQAGKLLGMGGHYVKIDFYQKLVFLIYFPLTEFVLCQFHIGI